MLRLVLRLFFLLAFLSIQVKCVGFAEELYCGLENCYDVLNVNRDEFDKATLSKLYRTAAKKHHPDRVRTTDPKLKEEAEAKFRLIATAYETLKDDEVREEYNYYLDHPEERFYNYYQYYRRRVAPKVDVRLVILGTIVAISIFQYWSAKSKYAEALGYALTVGKFRNQAIAEGIKRGELDQEKNGKLKKIKGRDNEMAIRKIIEENMDVRGGYKRESIYDTLIWHIVKLPLTTYHYSIWYAKWCFKYWLRLEEYDTEAKLYLIRKNMGMGEGQFACLTDVEHEEMLENELWKKEKFNVWKKEKDQEEREKLAKSGKYKRYRRWLKNNEGNTISFLDEEYDMDSSLKRLNEVSPLTAASPASRRPTKKMTGDNNLDATTMNETQFQADVTAEASIVSEPSTPVSRQPTKKMTGDTNLDATALVGDAEERQVNETQGADMDISLQPMNKTLDLFAKAPVGLPFQWSPILLKVSETDGSNAGIDSTDSSDTLLEDDDIEHGDADGSRKKHLKYSDSMISFMEKEHAINDEQVHELEATIKAREEELCAIKVELEHTKKKLEEERVLSEDLRSNNHRLKENLMEQDLRLDKLKLVEDETPSLVQAIKEANGPLNDLAKELDGAKQECMSLNEELTIRGKDLTKAQEDLEQLRNAYATLAAENTRLHEEATAHGRVVEERELELSLRNQELVESQQQFQEQNALHLQLIANCDELKQKAASFDAAIEAKAVEINLRDKEMAEAKEHLEQLRKENTTLAAENTRLQDEAIAHTRVVEETGLELSLRNQELVESQQQFQELNTLHLQLIANCDELQQKAASFDAAIEAKAIEINLRDKEMAEAKEHLEQLRKENTTLAAENTRLQDEAIAHTRVVEEKELELSLRNQELVESQQRLQEQNALHLQLIANCDELKQKAASFDAAIEAKAVEINLRDKEMAEAKEHLEQLREENTTLAAENTRLQDEAIAHTRVVEEKELELSLRNQALLESQQQLQAFNLQLASKYDEFKQKAESFDAVLEAKAMEIDFRNKELAESHELLEQLRSANATLLTENARLHQEATTARSKIVEETDQELSLRNQELVENQKQIQALTALNLQLVANCDEFKQKAEAIDAALEAKNAEIERLNILCDEFDDLEGKYRASIRELQQQLGVIKPLKTTDAPGLLAVIKEGTRALTPLCDSQKENQKPSSTASPRNFESPEPSNVNETMPIEGFGSTPLTPSNKTTMIANETKLKTPGQSCHDQRGAPSTPGNTTRGCTQQ
ncbi:unnamed protein product, partial [Mesorhabditis belari]|uniref:J domain-containing protein n=1 Tax=Mesorhabditis belari TaxID=2138241 RepID=A0AAF3J9D8_9BILA